MRDALVAVDASIPFIDGDGVALAGPFFLDGEIHVVEVMTVAAFATVSFLHPPPFIFRKLQALSLIFLARVDGA